MAQCLIAIGCNQGDCQTQIETALRQLEQLPGTRVVKISSLRQTAPVGQANRTFLNGAVLLETELAPIELMALLLELEAAAGRDRRRDAGNRPLDLDILLFDDLSVHDDRVVIPHPRMSFRRFVLEPAVEIAADWFHPELNCQLGQLLNQLDKRPNVIAVVTASDVGDLLVNQPQRCGRNVDDLVEWHWLSAKNAARDSISDLIEQAVAVDANRWLVLMTDDDAVLDRFSRQIKLLITSSEYPAAWRGPLWVRQVDLNQSATDRAEALADQVMTAIASMQPLNGAGLAGDSCE